jgi:hypothetical protein
MWCTDRNQWIREIAPFLLYQECNQSWNQEKSLFFKSLSLRFDLNWTSSGLVFQYYVD